MRRSLICPIAVVLGVGVRSILASFNFAAYPSCTQNILYETAPNKCDYDDSIEATNCLCSDTTWLKDIAEKIQSTCSCAELNISASTLVYACSLMGTPSALSDHDIIAAGDCISGGGDDSSSAAPAPSSGASNDANTASGNMGTKSGGDNNDSPTSDRIALGVGIGIGLPTALLAAITVWLQCRKRRR